MRLTPSLGTWYKLDPGGWFMGGNATQIQPMKVTPAILFGPLKKSLLPGRGGVAKLVRSNPLAGVGYLTKTC